MKRFEIFFMGFNTAILLIGVLLACVPVSAADLALPKKRAPELCLQTGREPYSGQTLQADKTCPSGLRWRFQK